MLIINETKLKARKQLAIISCNVSKNLYAVKNKMSLIVMEFMDGYTPLGDMIKDNHPKREIFKIMQNFLMKIRYISQNLRYKS